MREVYQLVHTLTYGDAISGEVLSLHRALGEQGIGSKIFAINVDPKYRDQADDYRSFPKSFNGMMLLHYSLGSALNDLYMHHQTARKGMIFHNLTPAHWFAQVNPRVCESIKHGVQELPQLCQITEFLLADSAYNASELQKLGFRANVLELPIDEQKWSVQANAGIARLLKKAGGLNLLHVGRLAPNKCIEDVIKTFHFLHHYIDKHSRLWLVGTDTDTELYSFSLKRLVRELDLESSVFFVGRMADCEVKALYQNCSSYLCMSEHEGFCLPLIEAMYLGLPTLAYGVTAIPDTMASAGILFTEKKYPELAELIYEIHQDADLRVRLIEAGYDRARQLSFAAFSNRITELFFSPQAEKLAAIR